MTGFHSLWLKNNSHTTSFFFNWSQYFFFFLFYFFFKLYIIVLVLPNIKMNPPQVYMCSPSWTLLPPPSPYHPSESSQCTSPKHPASCIEPGLATCFICQWTFRLLPCLSYCKQYCNKHWDAGIFLNYSFLQRYVQEWDFKTICAMCYVT